MQTFALVSILTGFCYLMLLAIVIEGSRGFFRQLFPRRAENNWFNALAAVTGVALLCFVSWRAGHADAAAWRKIEHQSSKLADELRAASTMAGQSNHPDANALHWRLSSWASDAERLVEMIVNRSPEPEYRNP